MGNMFGFGSTPSKRANSMHQPKDLKDLLSSMSLTFKDMDNVDKAIEKNKWARQFHEYLQRRELTNELASLQFLIMTEPLVTKRQSDQNSSSALFHKVLLTFFSEKQDILALTDDKLSSHLTGLSRQNLKDGPTKKHLKWVKEARMDPTVWSEGLEPRYKKFVEHPAVSPIACLLSIL